MYILCMEVGKYYVCIMYVCMKVCYVYVCTHYVCIMCLVCTYALMYMYGCTYVLWMLCVCVRIDLCCTTHYNFIFRSANTTGPNLVYIFK